jgi:hypothetical protein
VSTLGSIVELKKKEAETVVRLKSPDLPSLAASIPGFLELPFTRKAFPDGPSKPSGPEEVRFAES